MTSNPVTPAGSLMTAEQLMEWLQVKRSQYYRLIAEGLPYLPLSPNGHTKRFVRAEVQAWLDARRVTREPAMSAEAAAGPRRGRPRKDAARPEGVNRWLGDYRSGKG